MNRRTLILVEVSWNYAVRAYPAAKRTYQLDSLPASAEASAQFVVGDLLVNELAQSIVAGLSWNDKRESDVI